MLTCNSNRNFITWNRNFVRNDWVIYFRFNCDLLLALISISANDQAGKLGSCAFGKRAKNNLPFEKERVVIYSAKYGHRFCN